MVLTTSSPWPAHFAQNTSLILLSLLFLPLNTTILFLSYILRTINPKQYGAQVQKCPKPKTVLVTGVGMTKGLALARACYLSGHRVIGADFEPGWACGRWSTSLNGFYVLRKPTTSSSKESGSGLYFQDLLDVIMKEKVDLWVSCSGVASAVEDGEAKEIVEARTTCKAVQFDVKTTQTLHEKDRFIERTREIGLGVPETHTITRREDVDDALRKAAASGSGRKYIMKTIGMDDAARGDIMTLLPKETEAETKKYLDRLTISKECPWILQQFVNGEEFCTHSIVINGRVRAFVACPSAELLMHYRALPSDSALSQAMLKFTETYAAEGGVGLTGHLSFDFLVEDTTPSDPKKIVLYPIECNPRAHTAVCLFNGAPQDMVHGYMELLDGISDKDGPDWLATPTRNDAYCWIGHDFVNMVVVPTLSLVMLQLSYRAYIKSVATFIVHLLTWKDGTYEVWDPLPWFALYHVYWPLRFWTCLRQGTKWSRINVSTTKMFEC